MCFYCILFTLFVCLLSLGVIGFLQVGYNVRHTLLIFRSVTADRPMLILLSPR